MIDAVIERCAGIDVAEPFLPSEIACQARAGVGNQIFGAPKIALHDQDGVAAANHRIQVLASSVKRHSSHRPDLLQSRNFIARCCLKYPRSDPSSQEAWI